MESILLEILEDSVEDPTHGWDSWGSHPPIPHLFLGEGRSQGHLLSTVPAALCAQRMCPTAPHQSHKCFSHKHVEVKAEGYGEDDGNYTCFSQWYVRPLLQLQKWNHPSAQSSSNNDELSKEPPKFLSRFVSLGGFHGIRDSTGPGATVNIDRQAVQVIQSSLSLEEEELRAQFTVECALFKVHSRGEALLRDKNVWVNKKMYSFRFKLHKKWWGRGRHIEMTFYLFCCRFPSPCFPHKHFIYTGPLISHILHGFGWLVASFQFPPSFLALCYFLFL